MLPDFLTEKQQMPRTTKRSANDRLCRGVKKFALHVSPKTKKFMLNANQKLCFLLSFKWNAKSAKEVKKETLWAHINDHHISQFTTPLAFAYVFAFEISSTQNCRQFQRNYRAAKHQILIFLSAAFINFSPFGSAAASFLRYCFWPFSFRFKTKNAHVWGNYKTIKCMAAENLTMMNSKEIIMIDSIFQ